MNFRQIKHRSWCVIQETRKESPLYVLFKSSGIIFYKSGRYLNCTSHGITPCKMREGFTFSLHQQAVLLNLAELHSRGWAVRAPLPCLQERLVLVKWLQNSRCWIFSKLMPADQCDGYELDWIACLSKTSAGLYSPGYFRDLLEYYRSDG